MPQRESAARCWRCSKGKDVLVGVIDVATDDIETPEDVAETIEAAMQYRAEGADHRLHQLRHGADAARDRAGESSRRSAGARSWRGNGRAIASSRRSADHGRLSICVMNVKSGVPTRPSSAQAAPTPASSCMTAGEDGHRSGLRHDASIRTPPTHRARAPAAAPIISARPAAAPNSWPTRRNISRAREAASRAGAGRHDLHLPDAPGDPPGRPRRLPDLRHGARAGDWPPPTPVPIPNSPT